MSETLDQMMGRHAAELAELLRREVEKSYRAGMEGRPRSGRTTLRIINDEVAEEYGLNSADLLTKGRKCDEISHARFAAFYRAHKAGFSLGMIGNFYCGRDHTTVLHGIRRHEEMTARASRVAAE